MGNIVHRPLLISSWNKPDLDKIYNKALKLFSNKCVSNLINAGINSIHHFAIFSNGSKEGWAENEEYLGQIIKMIKYIDSFDYEDGSSSIEYVFLAYGSDVETEIIDSHEFKPERKYTDYSND